MLQLWASAWKNIFICTFSTTWRPYNESFLIKYIIQLPNFILVCRISVAQGLEDLFEQTFLQTCFYVHKSIWWLNSNITSNWSCGIRFCGSGVQNSVYTVTIYIGIHPQNQILQDQLPQDQLTWDQLPWDQLPCEINSHEINFPQDWLPSDRLPTR